MGAGLRHGIGQSLPAALAELTRGEGLQTGRVDFRVPDIEVAHAGEPAHRPAVRTHGRCHDLCAFGVVEAVRPGGDDETGRQSFDVPFPGTGQRFVEVVDVKHQLPLRRGQQPEVQQVRVPAQLGRDPRVRAAGQVGRHDRGGSPVEPERGLRHPAVADRDQLGHPSRGLCLKDRQWVRSVRRRPVDGVRRPRRAAPGLLALGRAFLGRAVGHRAHRGGRSFGHQCTPA